MLGGDFEGRSKYTPNGGTFNSTVYGVKAVGDASNGGMFKSGIVNETIYGIYATAKSNPPPVFSGTDNSIAIGGFFKASGAKANNYHILTFNDVFAVDADNNRVVWCCIVRWAICIKD